MIRVIQSWITESALTLSTSISSAFNSTLYRQVFNLSNRFPASVDSALTVLPTSLVYCLSPI